MNDATVSGTYYWKGVPFAKPPVGSLRWRAPQEPDPWTGLKPTKKFGNASIQNGRIWGPGANNTYDSTIVTSWNTPVGSEDSLTLNIWRPATSNTDLPVILFLHGGSNILGYTADPVFDGANLARTANAIVVTANYRLGVFGFFDLAQLKTGENVYDDSGNFAILDNIQALRFIQDNIAGFGGDNTNVTLMGQSAGAIDAWALITSPIAGGLFSKAIAMSGGISSAEHLPAGSIPILQPAATYAAQGKTLLHHLLIADGKAGDLDAAESYAATQTNAQIADYMRSKDAREILGLVLAKGIAPSGPIPEGTVVSADPIAAIRAGNYCKVPILASNTSHEGRFFAAVLALAPALGGKHGFAISESEMFTIMQNFNPEAEPTLKASDIVDSSYLPLDAPGTGYQARTELVSTILTTSNRNSVLNTLVEQQANVWFFEFSWAQEPEPWNGIFGASHGFDLPFVFGNFGPSVYSNIANSAANEPGRLALSDAMMRSIGAFALSGDPNNDSLGVAWSTWPAKLVFDAGLTETRITTG